VAAVLTLPLCLADLPDHAPSLKATGALVLLGVAGTGIAFLWFYTLISEIGPARASIIAYIAPGFSVAYGVVLLDEPFSAAAVGGLALILAGSWLAVGGRLPARLGRGRPVPAPVETG
jgi:drug/metabolite transporter (DMT)-like permease